MTPSGAPGLARISIRKCADTSRCAPAPHRAAHHRRPSAGCSIDVKLNGVTPAPRSPRAAAPEAGSTFPAASTAARRRCARRNARSSASRSTRRPRRSRPDAPSSTVSIVAAFTIGRYQWSTARPRVGRSRVARESASTPATSAPRARRVACARRRRPPARPWRYFLSCACGERTSAGRRPCVARHPRENGLSTGAFAVVSTSAGAPFLRRSGAVAQNRLVVRHGPGDGIQRRQDKVIFEHNGPYRRQAAKCGARVDLTFEGDDVPLRRRVGRGRAVRLRPARVERSIRVSPAARLLLPRQPLQRVPMRIDGKPNARACKTPVKKACASSGGTRFRRARSRARRLRLLFSEGDGPSHDDDLAARAQRGAQ